MKLAYYLNNSMNIFSNPLKNYSNIKITLQLKLYPSNGCLNIGRHFSKLFNSAQNTFIKVDIYSHSSLQNKIVVKSNSFEIDIIFIS